ncbi:MAG: hypothetical protein SGJ27_23015 [Candidatus Melainabacteria bacterium]|nr:hypothetical protein [Candidatus Melainabacteria bacterium]
MKYAEFLKKQLRLGLPNVIVPLLTLVTLFSLTATSAARAESNEWTVIVKAQEIKRAFQYKGSELRQVAKVDLVYRPSASDAEPKEYESVWCTDGKPIGMERKGILQIQRGRLFHIKVEQKAYSDEENKAIAFVLMHFSLQAYHRFCPILTISAPDQTFNNICMELRHRGCEDFVSAADSDQSGSVIFNMQSSPSRNVQRLHFKGRE